MLHNLYMKHLDIGTEYLGRNETFPPHRFAELRQEVKFSTVCRASWHVYYILYMEATHIYLVPAHHI